MCVCVYVVYLCLYVEGGRADIQKGVQLELGTVAGGQSLRVVKRLAPPPAVTANMSEIKYKA